MTNAYAPRIAEYHDRLGRCFELAALYVMHADETGDTEPALVHGQIRSERADRDRIEHAWVILDPGAEIEHVHDPVLSDTFPRQVYEAFALATEHARFTPRETRRETYHRLHYGPWAGPEEEPPVDPEYCANCGHPRADHGNRTDSCDQCAWELSDDPAYRPGDETEFCGGYEPDDDEEEP